MKTSHRVVLTSAASGLSLLAAFFAWGLYYRYTLQDQASTLMTETAQEILSEGNATRLLENTDPSALVMSPDFAALAPYGRLVAIDTLEGVAEVPNWLGGGIPVAQFATTAHFGLGTVRTEAILTYRDGRWMFTQFAVIPGPMAQ